MNIKKIASNLRFKMFIFYQRMPRGLKHYISKIIYKPKLGKKACIIGYAVFGPNVEIGDYSYFNDNARIHDITVGKYTRAGKNFQYVSTAKEYVHFSNYKFWGLENLPFIGTMPLEELHYYWTKCNIGNDVWIGENVTIVGNVTVGDGAVIAANSVITKDVESFSIVGGNPAKFIKKRLPDEAIKSLTDLSWWNWSPEEIYEKYDSIRVYGKNDFV